MESLIFITLQIGLVLAILGIATFISFRILDCPDLTIDGSFTLGAVVCVMVSNQSVGIIGGILGLILGSIFAGVCGYVTAFLNTKFKIQIILAGILTMTMLYSINLRISNNKPNMIVSNTLFENTPMINTIILMVIVIGVVVGINCFFKTRLGMSIRATGDNPQMVSASSINPDKMKIIGLVLSNALVGLSGGLYTFIQGFYDSTFGNGMLVMGVAIVVIGESVFFFYKKNTIIVALISAVIGSIMYRAIFSIALQFDSVKATDLKLISAIIIILAICLPKVLKRGEN